MLDSLLPATLPRSVFSDPVLVINRALIAENLTFSQFSLIKAIEGSGGELTMNALVELVGMTHAAIRQQVRRTLYFEHEIVHPGEPGSKSQCLLISLSADGRAKVDRMKRRLKCLGKSF